MSETEEQKVQEAVNQEVPAQEAPAQESEQPQADGKKPKPKKTKAREAMEWIVTIVAAVVIALAVRGLLFEPIRVDGDSMKNTLLDNEVLLVTKPEYIFGDPQRFDVVICHYPGRGNTNFVKRVVGVPGDTVEVRGGYLYVNGERYEEEYLDYRPDYDMAPFEVPEGKYFVLGDNRANSNDSHLVGPLDRSMIVGHVRHVLLPLDRWRAVE